MHILTINVGSSSLKFKLFQLRRSSDKPALLLSGIISNLTHLPCIFNLYNADGEHLLAQKHSFKDAVNPYLEALELVLNCNKQMESIDGIIHRVVHGGDLYTRITRLDSKVIGELTRFNNFAPLHQPYSLLIAEKFIKLKPGMPNYACFDTAFHQSMPEVNRIYALPWRYTQSGVKKYGFHGLSYAYISSVLAQVVGNECAKGKWIIAHLGSGSSLCAVENGQSIATTMGLSCLDGVPMMTRCGELDAQIPLLLQQEYGLTADEVGKMLNTESGLYGMCQIKDMTEILNSSHHLAKLAVELYCKQVAGQMAKLAVDLGGLNGIVYTGGIGENSSAIREKISHHLEWLGLKLNIKHNTLNQTLIHDAQSSIQVLVIKTDEEYNMIYQFYQLVQ